MKSRTTRRFWELYLALPTDIRRKADEAYVLWQENPGHPSLHFKRIDPEDQIYSARIDRRYRVLGALQGNTMVWFWIGKHEVYDRILN